MSPDLVNLLAAPRQPQTLFQAVDSTTKSRVGHKIFTLLYIHGSEVAHIYSNQPAAYPVVGRKPMGPTPWGALVMEGRQPFLGRDMEAIRWMFSDHALLASLGCGSVINIPIVYNDEAIGTMNLLDAEHHYTEADVPKVAELAPLLIPAFLLARKQA
jgi:hypothetical protein